MQQTIVMLGLEILPGCTAFLTFCLLLYLSVQKPVPRILKSCEEFGGLLKERSRNSNWYHKTELWLRRNGASFHMGQWIHPTEYLALRVVLSLTGGVVMSGISMEYGVMAAGILFGLPGWMISYLNKQDNVRLLPEIKLVYHALEIQIRAGVYVTEALAECYGSVHNARLRQALLDLAGDIVMKSDIYEALEHFQQKFDNRYIDTLCITILQALDSGQAVELLGDIAEQIKDMEGRVMTARKSALDRRITFYQLGVLAAVLGVVLYACISHMYAAALSF